MSFILRNAGFEGNHKATPCGRSAELARRHTVGPCNAGELTSLHAFLRGSHIVSRKNNELETTVSRQEATISKMAKEIAEIKKLLTTRSTNNEAPQAVPCEPTHSTSSAVAPTSAAKEPAPKRRALENLKERKLNDRVDNLEDKVDRIEKHLYGLEEYIKTTFTKMIFDKFADIEQTCQQLANAIQQITTQQYNQQQSWPLQQQQQQQQ